MSEPPAYDSRYLEGIRYFNDCEFFEAHEVWEDIWMDAEGPSRRFYQGLIQVAVCLHHFGNGNFHGARKLYFSCRGYLEDYIPEYLGLDVEKLLRELQACCTNLLPDDGPAPDTQLVVDLIPEIHLDPPPA